jgi:hypothetical protein
MDAKGLDARARALYENDTKHFIQRKEWDQLDLRDRLDRRLREEYLTAAAHEWITLRAIPIQREPAW